MGATAVKQRLESVDAAMRQRLESVERSLSGKWDRQNGNGVESLDLKQYKLFDYVCPNCKEKRQIQYFHSGGCFVNQMPTVVCGGCKEYIDPTTIFKTADFQCPQCSVIRRIRIPARPVPLETYKRSVATCDQCWFRGEVPTGRHVVAVCECCHMHASRLTDIWSENGDSLRLFCEGCTEITQAVVLPHALMARLLRSARSLEQGAIHFQCPQCKLPQHCSFEEIVSSRATCVCNGCGWRGPVPEEKKGSAAAQSRPGSSMSGHSRAAPSTSGTPAYGHRSQERGAPRAMAGTPTMAATPGSRLNDHLGHLLSTPAGGAAPMPGQPVTPTNGLQLRAGAPAMMGTAPGRSCSPGTPRSQARGGAPAAAGTRTSRSQGLQHEISQAWGGAPAMAATPARNQRLQEQGSGLAVASTPAYSQRQPSLSLLDVQVDPGLRPGYFGRSVVEATPAQNQRQESELLLTDVDVASTVAPAMAAIPVQNQRLR